VHLIHEGRGLDATPATIEKFKQIRDKESAELLTFILSEEISHVGFGIKWFKYILKDQFNKTALEMKLEFQKNCWKYFKGPLKAPFN